MPKSILSIINDTLIKAGVAADNEELKKFLTHTELDKITISDDLSNTLEKNLFTIEAAKNKQSLADHFQGQSNIRITAELKKIAKKYNLSDAEIDEVLKDADVVKKIESLSEQVKSKSSTVKPDEKLTAAEAKIAELNASIQEKAAEVERIRNEAESKVTQERLAYAKKAKIASQPWSDAYTEDLRYPIMEHAISSELAKDGRNWSLSLQDGNVQVVTKEGLKAYDSANKEVTFDSLIGQIMAEKKLIKVSDPAPNPQPVIVPQTGNGLPMNPAVAAAVAASTGNG